MGRADGEAIPPGTQMVGRTLEQGSWGHLEQAGRHLGARHATAEGMPSRRVHGGMRQDSLGGWGG